MVQAWDARGGQPRAAELSSGRVLVIEADRETRRLLADCLAAHGYYVEEAADGEAGLYLAHEAVAPFDLVLLDDELPDATVLEMLPALRAVAAASLVVVMSAATGRGVFYDAITRGAYDVVQKPPWLADVLRVVRLGVQERRAGLGAARPSIRPQRGTVREGHAEGDVRPDAAAGELRERQRG